MDARARPMLSVRLTVRFRWAAVGGAILEFLAFAAFGAYNLWWGVTMSGRLDGSALLVQDLIALAILALAAGFGLGALLLSLRWIEVRIVGAAFHLIATAIATWAAIWMGMYQVQYVTYSPNTDASWPPAIAFALAAAVIAIGLAVLISLFLPVGRKGQVLSSRGLSSRSRKPPAVSAWTPLQPGPQRSLDVERAGVVATGD